MIRRLFEKCLLTPSDLHASTAGLEVVSVFNPGVAEYEDSVVLLLRVAEKPAGNFPGYVGSPRWTPELGIVIDWIPEDEVTMVDPRVFRMNSTGAMRLTFISHLRIAHSRDGRTIDGVTDPIFLPVGENEEYGVEDPRITFIDGAYYFTYVAVSRHGACTALASTTNFAAFNRHGIILPCENKDVLLFPQKIHGEYAILHRPNPHTHFAAPEIWYATSPDLTHWGRHCIVTLNAAEWETGRIGGGIPPLLTPYGWLELYHANAPEEETAGVGRYVMAALLLDKDDPCRVIGRTMQPLLTPERDYEKQGFLSEVVFPTGLVQRGDTLQVYYGAADTATAVVELSLQEILNAIRIY